MLSDSKVDKLASAIKNDTGVTLRLSGNMTGTNETKFPHKLLLTDIQVTSLCKAFSITNAALVSTKIKLTKNQISRIK